MGLSQTDINEILNAIKAESVDIAGLVTATSLEGLTSLPAMQGTKMVLAPIGLLEKPARDAAAVAIDAARQAAGIVQQAKQNPSIEELHSIGGGLIMSPASGEVERISSYIGSGGAEVVQLFIKEGSRKEDRVRLKFQQGDLVRCSRDNITEGAGVRHYWVQVDGIDQEQGSLHILRSRFTGDMALPQEGDELVTLGSATDPSRRGAIYISADDSGERITVLSGIKTASLAGCRRVVLGSLDELMHNGELMRGYGLASDNCYLTGRFVLESTGRAVEAEISDTAEAMSANGANLIRGTRDWAGWSLHERASRVGLYQGAERIAVDNAESQSYCDMAQAAFRFAPNTAYTLSFWANGSALDTYCFPSLGSVILATSGTARPGETRNDTMCSFILSGQMTRHYVTFRTGSSVPDQDASVLLRVPAGEDASAAGVKLELGERMTVWGESPLDMADTVARVGKIEADNVAFRAEYAAEIKRLDGSIGETRTMIEQTAERISLKADGAAQGAENLLAPAYIPGALANWWQSAGEWVTRPQAFEGFGCAVKSPGGDFTLSLRDSANSICFMGSISAGEDLILTLRVSGDKYLAGPVGQPGPQVTAAIYQGKQTAEATVYATGNMPQHGGRMAFRFRTTRDGRPGLSLTFKNVPAGITVTVRDIMLERGDVAHGFTPTSTEVGDLMRRMLATGIDIMSGRITVTADDVVFTDNSGERQTLIQGGRIKAELIDTDKLTARRLVAETAGRKTASINEDGDGAHIVYAPKADGSGVYRVAVYGLAEITVKDRKVMTIARGYDEAGAVVWYQSPRGELIDPSAIPYTVETFIGVRMNSLADGQTSQALTGARTIYRIVVNTDECPEGEELNHRASMTNTYTSFSDDAQRPVEGYYFAPTAAVTQFNGYESGTRSYWHVDSGGYAEAGLAMWTRKTGGDVSLVNDNENTV